MRNSAKCLLVCSVLLLTGIRDPFRPPDDPCATGELAQWHYRGMVAGQQRLAILQDGQQRWHRMKMHDRFPAGWQITAINETELVIAVGRHVNPGNGRGNEKERIQMTLRIVLLLLAFSHPLWAAAPKPVTLVVDDVPVAQVLRALVTQENRNLVISPDVSGTLSLNLTGVPGGKHCRRSLPAPGSFCTRSAAFFMFIPRHGCAIGGNV